MTELHEFEREESGPLAELKLGPLLIEMAGKLDELHKAWKKRGEVVFQVPLYGQITGTTGNDAANSTNSNLSTDRGLCYSIRRLSVSGFTAGTVIAYLNAIEPVATWTFSATTDQAKYYSQGGLLMQPGDRLTLGANGVTGTAQLFGVADAFPIWYLPEYLD